MSEIFLLYRESIKKNEYLSMNTITWTGNINVSCLTKCIIARTIHATPMKMCIMIEAIIVGIILLIEYMKNTVESLNDIYFCPYVKFNEKIFIFFKNYVLRHMRLKLIVIKHMKHLYFDTLHTIIIQYNTVILYLKK